MNATTLDTVRHAWRRRVRVVVMAMALGAGALPAASASGQPVAATDPATTVFSDINPDNGPGLPIDQCPDPCTSQHNGGRVNGLAIAPGFPGLVPDTWYAASEVGGLFKSIDGGGHWEHLDRHIPHLTWDVAAEPGGLRVYATSFYDGRLDPLTGIQVSSDGGDTWSHADLPDQPGCPAPLVFQPSAFGIALRPGTSGEVIVGTNCGLARSMDNGANWDWFDPTAGDPPGGIWDVAALPGGLTYACGADGLLVSASGAGGSWHALGKPNPGVGTYCSLAVDPDDQNVVFVSFAFPSFADIVVAGPGDLFEGDVSEPATCPAGFTHPCPTVAWSERFPYPDGPEVEDQKSRVPFVVTNDRSAGFDPDNPSDGFDLWVADGSLWRVPCHAGQTPRCTIDQSKWVGSFTDHIGLPGQDRFQMAHGDSGDLEFNPHAATDACPVAYSSDGGVYTNSLDETDSTPDVPDACQSPAFLGANVGLHAYYLRGFDGDAPIGDDRETDEDLYVATQDNGLFYSADGGSQTPTWTHGIGGDVIDVAGDDVRTVATVPTKNGVLLLVGGRGFTNMDAKVVLPSQPLWDSEALAQIGPEHYLFALRISWAGKPRGIRDIDVSKIDSQPLGTEFANAPWPEDADAPCHVVVGQSPTGPVPYVLAGRCWYGTQDIGWPASGPADQLWTLENGEWQQRKPGPKEPGGTVSDDAGFGIVAVDPKNPLRLYASVLFDGNSRMMRSSDGGKTWTTDTALTRLMYGGYKFDLRDPGDGIKVMPQASLVAFDPFNANIIVAGGRASGVFISSDGGQSWGLLTDPRTPGTSDVPHLPNPAFARFDHDKPSVVRLYLGTGRGLWRVELENADLSVTKTDSPNPVVIGQNVTYAIRVSNAGPDMAQNATVEDQLPKGTSFQSLTAPSGWTCEHPPLNGSGVVRCTKTSMAPGSADFSLVLRVGGSVDPVAGVTNTVRVVSAAVDHVPSNNTASTTTAVIVPVAINISPGTFPNAVNRRGQVTVAVLTTSAGQYGLPMAFDATTIDPLSARFGLESVVLAGGGAVEVHKTGHLQDAYELDEVTLDGDIDMVLHYRVSDANLATASTRACVSGTFDTGARFLGCDSIVVVP